MEASDGSSLSISDMRQLPESCRELAAHPSALSQKRQSRPGSWRPALADSALREGLALPQERPPDSALFGEHTKLLPNLLLTSFTQSHTICNLVLLDCA